MQLSVGHFDPIFSGGGKMGIGAFTGRGDNNRTDNEGRGKLNRWQEGEGRRFHRWILIRMHCKWT